MRQEQGSEWAAPRYRLTAELRSGWRFVVSSAVVVGLASGAALGAWAAARRTDSVFDRLQQATLAPDVLVLPESIDAVETLDRAALAAMPGVELASQPNGFIVLHPDGRFVNGETFVATDDEFLHTIARPVMIHGRLPVATDEIYATEGGRDELGIEVGEQVELLVLAEVTYANQDALPDDFIEQAMNGEVGVRRVFTLVGVGFDGAAVTEPDLSQVIFPRAFNDEVHPGPIYTGVGVRLDGGDAALPDFISRVSALVGPGEVGFQTSANARATAQRALRPQVVALQIFAVVMAIAAAFSWLLAVARRRRAAHRDDEILDALGMTRSSHLRIELVRSLVVAVIAVVIAVVTMAVVSCFMPVSEARRIEPSPGFDIDPTVVWIGSAAIVLLTVVIGCSMMLVTFRAARGPSRVSRTMAAQMPGPSVSIGVANALDPGSGTSTSPSRSTLVGAAVGVLVIVASATFGASLNRFVDEPDRYGWAFDLVLSAGEVSDGQGDRVFAEIVDAATADSDVAGLASMVSLQAVVAGRAEPVMGVRRLGEGSPVGPTIVRGRAPTAADEVAVGEQTLRRLGRSICDELVVDDEVPFTIVGTTVLFPSPDSNSGDALVLGGGLLFTFDGVARIAGDDVGAGAGSLLVALHDDADPGAFVERIEVAMADMGLPGSVLAVGPTLPRQLGSPIEPAEVVAYRRVRMTPLVLAGLLAVLAAVSVSQALVLSVRRRRRELGTLRAVGFTSRQVRSTIAWQATTVAVIGLVVGVPFGVVAGRLLWVRVASQLGVGASPVVPWVLVAALVPAVLLSANLVAAIPARRAVRVSTADALRSE